MRNNAQLYKALSDETRLRIVALLLSQGELCVCHIIAALNQPQSTVSRHLAHLRNAGLVSDRRSGLWIYYSINEGDPSRRELISFLKKQLLQSDAATADRQFLANCGNDDCCS